MRRTRLGKGDGGGEKNVSPQPPAFFAFLFTERLFTTISVPGAGYLFPHSLHTQFIQRLVPQYQTDSHTSVPFRCSSILSSLGETKNASLPVSLLSLAHASIVADQVFNYDD